MILAKSLRRELHGLTNALQVDPLHNDGKESECGNGYTWYETFKHPNDSRSGKGTVSCWV